MLARSSATIGYALTATGVVEPLGVPGTGLTNFFGYVLWSVWLIALAVIVLRNRRRVATSDAGSARRRSLP